MFYLVCIYFVCSYYIAGRVLRSSLEIESTEFSQSLAYYVCVNLVFLESRQMEQVISKRRGVILCLNFIWSPQSHRTVGSLWRESGLNWIDFLPEGEDIQAFISQQVGNEAFWSNQQISVNIQPPFSSSHHPFLSASHHFPNPNRNCSSSCRTARASRLFSQKGSCLLPSLASSWRGSCWRTWPLTSRYSTGWRYDEWHVDSHIS